VSPVRSQANPQSRALAFLRIAIGMLFLIFAEYKLTSTKFIWGGGLRGWIVQFLEVGQCYPFLRPFLRHVVLSHTVLFATAVSLSELLIGLSLVSGILVRWASLGGLLLMLTLLFSSNYPGPHVPLWQYFGASLDHSVLALCFLTFLIAGSNGLGSLRRPH
jgi:uncharacterized membrane protein YphA (DoxX/SURF4 family)